MVVVIAAHGLMIVPRSAPRNSSVLAASSEPVRPSRDDTVRRFSHLALLLLVPGMASAQAPDHAWRTLDTPHFQVHFHEGLYPLALRAAGALERSHEILVPLLETLPTQRTQVVLSDDSDDANGSATASIRPTIQLLAEPPDDLSVLGDYDDYVLALVAHEYTHVLHLGIVEGVPRLLNAVIGDVFVPNALTPRFVTEGLAVAVESMVTSGGRVRSSMFDMFLRADVLEGRVLELGQLTNGPERWPRGTAAYLYGGRFMAWIAAREGFETFAAFGHDYGDDLVPYAVNLSLARATGSDFIELYEEWKLYLRERYGDQARIARSRGPITEPAVRTRHGERTGSPRFLPATHHLAYVEATPDRLPRLRTLDVDSGEDRVIRELKGGGSIAPLPDGAVVLARPELLRAYRVVGDLFRVDGGGERRITRGARASEVDVSADGRSAIHVRREAGRTTLWRVDLASGASALVYTPPPGRVVYTPRFSPDGGRVAFSRTRADVGRDVVVLDLASGAARELTDDTAVDLDPAWSPDGATVYLASDRTGIFNLYAVPAAGGALTRLTNVLTGAFEPTVSSDGAWIGWTTYSSWGFDVAAARLDDLAPAPAEAYVNDRPAPLPDDPAPLRPLTRYQPAGTLLPQSWLPWIAADAQGTAVGVITSGRDAVGRHAWSATGGVGLASGQPSVSVGYGYRGWYPSLSLGASSAWRYAYVRGGSIVERASAASAGLTFPFPSLRRQLAFSLGYEVAYFDPEDPDSAQEGFATEVSAGWTFSSAERPAESISPEDGISASLTTRYASPALGGDFSYAAVGTGAAGYLRLPWLRHHVLATGLRWSVGSGDIGDRTLYGLGGPIVRDPILDLLYTGEILGGSYLRGYERGAFTGSKLLLASAEYRFPLAVLDQGPFTLPLYAGRLSGAVFADAGDADDVLSVRDLHTGVGAELRLDVTVGWYLTALLRVGWAYGLDVDEGGGHHPYLSLGSWF